MRRGLLPPSGPRSSRVAREDHYRLFTGLLVPVDDCIDGVDEQAKRHKRASMRQTRPFSLMSERVSHKCLSAATIASTERPIAWAISLVARRDLSVVRLCSEIYLAC